MILMITMMIIKKNSTLNNNTFNFKLFLIKIIAMIKADDKSYNLKDN